MHVSLTEQLEKMVKAKVVYTFHQVTVAIQDLL